MGAPLKVEYLHIPVALRGPFKSRPETGFSLCSLLKSWVSYKFSIFIAFLSSLLLFLSRLPPGIKIWTSNKNRPILHSPPAIYFEVPATIQKTRFSVIVFVSPALSGLQLSFHSNYEKTEISTWNCATDLHLDTLSLLLVSCTVKCIPSWKKDTHLRFC